MLEGVRVLVAVVLCAAIAAQTGIYLARTFGHPSLERPVPGGGENDQTPQRYAASGGSSSSDQQSGTDQVPFVIKIAPSPNAQPETATQRKERDQKATEDWWAVAFAGLSALFALLLVIVTGGLWMYTYRLWQTTLRAVKGEEKAAKAMTKLADDTEVSSRRQLRAYVFVENAWVRWLDEESVYYVAYRIKNYGATPATSVVTLNSAVAVNGEPDELPIPIETTTFGSMAPHSDFIDCETKGIVDITPEDLQKESKSIILVGKIDYKDAFGEPRWTTFCFTATGILRSNGEMDVHERGNDHI